MKKFLALFLLLGVMLASITASTAGGFRGGFSSRSSSSFSSRSSFGGFRSSTPSYRSFSSSPSRSFTFRSSSSYSRPSSYSSRPAARSTYRSSSTTVNNHYHDGGSRGFGLMDYFALDAITNRNHAPTYVATSPGTIGSVPVVNEHSTVVYQEESHFWRNFFITIAVVGLFVGLIKLLDSYDE